MKRKKHHGHDHVHKSHEDVKNRLKRATGHLQSVHGMIEDHKTCPEILQQLNAVIAALNGCRTLLLQDHMESCLLPAVNSKDKHLIDELLVVIKQALKV